MEFHLPSHRLDPRALNAALAQFGYKAPILSFTALRGFLKGFIDLVFEHEGKFFILDWKSNHLGDSASDYSADSLKNAMDQQGYHLQYLLYSIALDRYLKLRLANYRREEHFGGVVYLFVRGVRPDWKSDDGAQAGLYFHKPTSEAIQHLSDLFNPIAVAA